MSQGSSGSNNDPTPPRGELTPEELDAFKKRASDLGARLNKVEGETRAKRGEPAPDQKVRGEAFGQAMRISVELIVGIAVGGFIGKVLDNQFSTGPVFLIVFLMLGFMAGLMNIIRTARRLQAEAEPLQRQAKPAPDAEEDGEK